MAALYGHTGLNPDALIYVGLPDVTADSYVSFLDFVPRITEFKGTRGADPRPFVKMSCRYVYPTPTKLRRRWRHEATKWFSFIPEGVRQQTAARCSRSRPEEPGRRCRPRMRPGGIGVRNFRRR